MTELVYMWKMIIKKSAQHAVAADPRFATKTAQGTKASSFAPRGQALAKAQRENVGMRF
jgi:hypothetical protein